MAWRLCDLSFGVVARPKLTRRSPYSQVAADNCEGNLCLAATGTTNEDVIETEVCDGTSKYQAWTLDTIKDLPEDLDHKCQ